jgi:hypothetical protein
LKRDAALKTVAKCFTVNCEVNLTAAKWKPSVAGAGINISFYRIRFVPSFL